MQEPPESKNPSIHAGSGPDSAEALATVLLNPYSVALTSEWYIIYDKDLQFAMTTVPAGVNTYFPVQRIAQACRACRCVAYWMSVL